MTTKERILNDIKEAMKSGNNARRDTLRMINSAFKQIEVDERVVLDEERIAKILQSEIKRRGDSVAAYKAGGREDLAAKEEAEIAIISEYLPRQLTDEELRAAVGEIVAKVGKNMGAVIAAARESIGAKADSKRISTLAKELTAK